MDADKIEQMYKIIAKTDCATFRHLHDKMNVMHVKEKKGLLTPLLKLFKQIKNRPNIVDDETFRADANPLWFSGVRDLKKSVKWFQRGDFKWKYGLLGQGFYFAEDFDMADAYADDGVIVAKPTADARIIESIDLTKLIYNETPCINQFMPIPKKSKSAEERAATVGTFLRMDNTATAAALLFGKDIVTESLKEGRAYCIINRGAVIQPQNPDHKCFCAEKE